MFILFLNYVNAIFCAWNVCLMSALTTPCLVLICRPSVQRSRVLSASMPPDMVLPSERSWRRLKSHNMPNTTAHSVVVMLSRERLSVYGNAVTARSRLLVVLIYSRTLDMFDRCHDVVLLLQLLLEAQSVVYVRARRPKQRALTCKWYW